ncbi:MAG: hypothetical protein AB7F22_07855 [Reyranella sp.]
MADHFLGINRGVPGTKDSDFTYGTSTGSTDIELRVADAKALTREDVVKALEAFSRFIDSPNVHIAGTLFPVGH